MASLAHPLLAHQGGWDEMLLTAVLVFGMLGDVAVASSFAEPFRRELADTRGIRRTRLRLLRRPPHTYRRAVSFVRVPGARGRGVKHPRLPPR